MAGGMKKATEDSSVAWGLLRLRVSSSCGPSSTRHGGGAGAQSQSSADVRWVNHANKIANRANAVNAGGYGMLTWDMRARITAVCRERNGVAPRRS